MIIRTKKKNSKRNSKYKLNCYEARGFNEVEKKKKKEKLIQKCAFLKRCEFNGVL